ncbi:Uncharacterised protein [Mycobacteroides abscessus]|nr:Uncharacterised protein [Mycobacteroides abscessus]
MRSPGTLSWWIARAPASSGQRRRSVCGRLLRTSRRASACGWSRSPQYRETAEDASARSPAPTACRSASTG